MDPFLALAVVEGCGPGLVASLLDPQIDPTEVLRRPPPHLPPAVRARLRDPGLEGRVEAVLASAERLGLEVWTAAHPSYPERLRHAPLRPLVLFGRGSAGAVAHTPTIAVVGSRTPTPYGEAAVRDFTGAAAAAGFAIWSGLAFGIDAAAHEAALRADAPTVAVLAGGLDVPHPAGNEGLAHRIIDAGGFWLSESPPGLRPARGHFPRRNRILAGAVDAVLVVEAGERSGALHTARFAADAGVPVFAVPGPYTSPRSRGCHRLLEDGADLAADPVSLLRRMSVECALQGRPVAARALDLGADERRILELVAAGPRPADLVQRESGLVEARFLEVLFGLLDRGALCRLAGDVLGRGHAG